MSRKSRNKGRLFEQEVTNLFKDAGYPAARTGEYKADDVLVCLNGHDLVVECKRRARGFCGLYKHLEQGDMVVHRDDRQEPLVTMPLQTFFSLRQEAS